MYTHVYVCIYIYIYICFTHTFIYIYIYICGLTAPDVSEERVLLKRPPRSHNKHTKQ